MVSAVMFWLSGSTSANTGLAPQVTTQLARGDEAARRHDDLVARPDAEAAQGQLQRHRAVGERDGVPAADRLGELGLELPPLVAGPVVDLARAQDRAATAICSSSNTGQPVMSAPRPRSLITDI